VANTHALHINCCPCAHMLDGLLSQLPWQLAQQAAASSSGLAGLCQATVLGQQLQDVPATVAVCCCVC
jgi:hypothetical protein